jgi:hypothetical protein
VSADERRMVLTQVGLGGQQISTVNVSIATYIRARQPDQIGHRADTLSWNRNSVHPLKGRGAVSALAHP